MKNVVGDKNLLTMKALGTNATKSATGELACNKSYRPETYHVVLTTAESNSYIFLNYKWTYIEP